MSNLRVEGRERRGFRELLNRSVAGHKKSAKNEVRLEI